jgi:hypothetical protein
MKPLDDLFEKPAALDMPEMGLPQSERPKKETFAPEAVGAMVGGPVGAVAAGQLKQMFMAKPEDQIQREALSEIIDPEHEAELTKIKTQAMLSEFMAADPVISTYDSDEIAAAYNQITQLTPRAAMQPAIMRGLLRRYLQQQDALEPHEAGQLADVEMKLKQLSEPAKPPIAGPISLRETM